MDEQPDAIIDAAPDPAEADEARHRASCLDEADMPYHRHVMAEVQQIAALEQRIAAIRAASVSWMAYVSPRYGLGPQDTVDTAGTITRADG